MSHHIFVTANILSKRT